MTDDYSKLADDAYAQAHINFHKAIETIDNEFGEGFAKKNPYLINGLIQAAAMEYSGVIQALKIQEQNDQLKEMNCVFRDLVEAIQHI
jgi:hypothetical protein